MGMKYASATFWADTTNADLCDCLLFLPPSIVSGILSGCHLHCLEAARQQNAKPSFAETKMSEQHFRCVTEPQLSRFQSLGFKRLQLLTKFSATGNCSVPSSLPVSRSAVCLTFAFLVVLRILCWLFPVSEGFVIAVNSVSSMRCMCMVLQQMQFPSLREIFSSWFDSGRSGWRDEWVTVVVDVVQDGMLRI